MGTLLLYILVMTFLILVTSIFPFNAESEFNNSFEAILEETS